jgi:hypothetical protein
MESVYFCSEKINNDVAKVLKDDNFMHISYIIRDSGKEGFYLYAEATPEDTKLLDQKLKDLGAEKVTGHEERSVINDIKTEEENAASGMGMIFG